MVTLQEMKVGVIRGDLLQEIHVQDKQTPTSESILASSETHSFSFPLLSSSPDSHLSLPFVFF